MWIVDIQTDKHAVCKYWLIHKRKEMLDLLNSGLNMPFIKFDLFSVSLALGYSLWSTPSFSKWKGDILSNHKIYTGG